jgi:hypothetical protein
MMQNFPLCVRDKEKDAYISTCDGEESLIFLSAHRGQVADPLIEAFSRMHEPRRRVRGKRLYYCATPSHHSVDGVPGGISSLTACRAWAREW